MKRRILAVVTVALIALQCIAIPASSAEEPKFTFGLELYDANALPQGGTPPGTARQLNPLQLRVNQEIAVAVRYSDLDVMNYNGIQCLAASFSYDESRFELNYFETGDGGTVLWEVGEMLSSEWIPEALQYGYTASASDRKTEKEGIRRVYIQYIAEGDRSSGTVCTENDAYVGAFYFTVKQAIAESEGVCFGWSDYAVGLYSDDAFTDDGVTNYNRAVLQADMEHFEEPADVPVATVEQPPEPEGVTVRGEVRSYNPKNPVELTLYRRTGDSYETPAYNITIPAEVTGTGRVTQEFVFEGVSPGQYQLVIEKAVHTSITVNNIIVGTADIDFTLNETTAVQLFSLCVGDVDANGSINLGDFGVVISNSNYNKSTGEAGNAACDLDGDGMINLSDFGVLISSENYNKGGVVITLE